MSVVARGKPLPALKFGPLFIVWPSYAMSRLIVSLFSWRITYMDYYKHDTTDFANVHLVNQISKNRYTSILDQGYCAHTSSLPLRPRWLPTAAPQTPTIRARPPINLPCNTPRSRTTNSLNTSNYLRIMIKTTRSLPMAHRWRREPVASRHGTKLSSLINPSITTCGLAYWYIHPPSTPTDRQLRFAFDTC